MEHKNRAFIVFRVLTHGIFRANLDPCVCAVIGQNKGTVMRGFVGFSVVSIETKLLDK